MKGPLLLTTGILLSALTFAQTDSVQHQKADTLYIGNMLIIKRPHKPFSQWRTETGKIKKHKNRHTNWMVLDLGVSHFNDRTTYNTPSIQDPSSGFAPGSTADWFKLRNAKSINVNIWFFLQQVNLIKDVVHFTYGLGLELNNYRYTSPILYETRPTRVVWEASASSSRIRKNKLAADYLTLPLMLNFNLTPHWKKNGIGFSTGMSVGYLYSSRQKIISSIEGKEKTRDDFDLRPWKLSYIAEVQLGRLRLYGSLATQSMFRKGLDHTPYQVGFRFSSW